MRKRVDSTRAVERIPLEGCMKIIVVDDHILFREGITLQINRQADMSVVGVGGSVRDAADLARKLRPDLILMDFSLPDGTGLDAAQFILSEQPNAKIVFLTTHDDDERLFSAVRMGARGYLMKNIPVARLLAALRGVGRGEAAISREMTARLMDEFARANQPTAPMPSPFPGLTARELQVLRELATDATNREIADRLFISDNTVRNHMHNILEKMGVASRREAVNLARKHGIGSLYTVRSDKE
jgi:DNA-binding NarL/FixJ family response regulator